MSEQQTKPEGGDKYDRAIKYLTEHPEEIAPAWTKPSLHPAGCLFAWTGRRLAYDASRECGCLTMIRGSPLDYAAPTRELTEAIFADHRIPINVDKITPATFPVFAEWRRRLDRELGAGPVWHGGTVRHLIDVLVLAWLPAAIFAMFALYLVG